MTIIPFKCAIPLLATTLLVAGCTLSVKQGNQPLHPLRQKIEADMVRGRGPF
ncbi:hypothetical protein [Aeromonas veronii]|uniref:hypothetical protein n=1 Tax=Aeromonas veronii TaxID=654 RepID=UPI003B9E7491